VPTTVHNPKSNGVIERVHLTMGDMLRTITCTGTDWMLEVQRTLDAVAWAIRTTISPELKYSPCHFAFSQDMLFCCTVSIDWAHIHNVKANQAITCNVKENRTRLEKQYAIGD
jgi:hypothetical protein